ncbi:MAG: hypothetical protein LBO20_10630 [Bifidobacteriaceae bacterium]|nr:hypothetical protein [Bifidobacteriaceae bacterium]
MAESGGQGRHRQPATRTLLLPIPRGARLGAAALSGADLIRWLGGVLVELAANPPEDSSETP